MNKKTPVFFLGITLLIQLAVFGQSPDKALKRAAKAMGGEKAMRLVLSRSVSGTITQLSNGAKGSFSESMSVPNLYTRGFDLNGFETEAGYNGRSGWVRDSKDGLRTLTGTEFKDFQAESAYRNNRWLNYKSEKARAVSGGQATINGKTADLVTITTQKGTRFKLYFDVATGLLVREEIPSGDALAVYDLGDYRAVNGVQEPFLITLTFGQEKFEIKLDSITHNRQAAKSKFDFPVVSGEPLPDIPTLLRELQANEERIEALLEKYSYTENRTMRELQKDGTLAIKESETYLLTFYKGYRIRRLTARNGKPLNPKEQADEDEKVADRVGDLEKKIAKQAAKGADGPPDENSRRVSTAEVLRASKLINPRRERFRGRDVIVFDFEPNPDFDTKNAKSVLKFFGKTAGVMWIDPTDKQVVRIEAMLTDSFKVGGGLLANLKRGATFTMEQERINNEIWLPSQMDINLSIKVFLVRGINLNTLTKYSDYRRFDTEIKDSKIDQVKTP